VVRIQRELLLRLAYRLVELRQALNRIRRQVRDVDMGLDRHAFQARRRVPSCDGGNGFVETLERPGGVAEIREKRAALNLADPEIRRGKLLAKLRIRQIVAPQSIEVMERCLD